MITNKDLIENNKFFLIAGPCAIEGKEMAEEICGKIKEIADEFELKFVFKGSFKKANRSRIDSFTGIGDHKALEILKDIGKKYNVPTTTDIHEVEHSKIASQFVDILQIPAFLARQTDLIVSAAKTGKIVNIKKGQFMSPESMSYAVAKVTVSGNNSVMITERGNMFGYQDLIIDFRGIPVMKNYAPVILDVTHSLQQPNQKAGITGGRPEMIETIAKAGIVSGADGIFIETHIDPKNAKSDGKNMLHLNKLKNLIEKLVKLKFSIS